MNTNHLNLHAAIMQQTAGLQQQLQQSVNTVRIYNWTMRVQRHPIPEMVQNSTSMTEEEWLAFCDQINRVLQPTRRMVRAQAIMLGVFFGGMLLAIISSMTTDFAYAFVLLFGGIAVVVVFGTDCLKSVACCQPNCFAI